MDITKAFMVGQWKVEPELNKISNAESETILVPKVMAILLTLVEGNGEPLSLKTLMASVWKEQVVSDSSVYQAIAQLRKALGDTAAEPTYIQRVSGKGYRLIVQAKALEHYSIPTKIDTHYSHASASNIPERKISKFAKHRLTIWIVMFMVVILSVLLLSNRLQAPNKQESPISIAQIKSISLQRLNTEKLDEAKNLDALNDVLLTQLMQIKQMRVVSLNSNAPHPTTQAVIKGRIEKQDNNIRVFLQLVSVDSQEIIWAKVFNGKENDLFALQDTIVDTLLTLFRQPSTSSVFDATTIDNHTFEQYLLGRHLWQQRNSRALYRAKTVFENMQQEHTLFPLAAVGLCDTYHYLSIYGDWSLKQALNKCQPLLQQALAQQPELGQAVAAQALLLSRQGKKSQASKLFEKAIELAPNYPFSYVWHAEQNRRMGKYKEGLSLTKTAYALAPMSPMVNRSLAYAYLNAGNKTQARFYYRRALDLQFDYTDRAIEELDFLPMTIERARAFLSWAQQHPSVMKKRRSYQLTQAQIDLALGNHSAVHKTLDSLQGQQINPSFRLFIQTSLAAANGQYQDVISLIEQRMAIHQDNARYAGAYLLALEQLGDDDKAYDAFLRLRPELAQRILNQEHQREISITSTNRYLLTYLVQLQARRGAMQLVETLAAQLDRSFEQGDSPQDIYYARWLLFRGHQEQAKALILRLMNNGWLPDYNAKLYPEAIMAQLFMETGLGVKAYQVLLQKNREQVTAGFEQTNG